MSKAGVHNGVIVVVDRSLDPLRGRIVVAIIDGVFAIRYLTTHQGLLHLETSHPNHSLLNLLHHNDVQIWGVAIYSIHSLNDPKA